MKQISISEESAKADNQGADQLKVIQLDPYGDRGIRFVAVEYYGLKIELRPLRWSGIQITTGNQRLEVIPGSTNSIILKTNGSLFTEEVKLADELNRFAAGF